MDTIIRNLKGIRMPCIDQHEAGDDTVRVLRVDGLPLEVQPAEALDVTAQGSVGGCWPLLGGGPQVDGVPEPEEPVRLLSA